ncbi:TrpR-related protein YerC/YecD [Candidatus Amesbacteria bacterium]|nr:TrpR-related protein YerC/YecD [Candidatus Amesbacteria bacterium]
MDKLNLEKDKQLLLDSLKKAQAARELPAFLDDLLTEEEILDLAQRLKIAKLIIEGKIYDEIAEKVNTSTSTVSKIGQVLKYGKGGLNKVFTKSKTKGGGSHAA